MNTGNQELSSLGAAVSRAHTLVPLLRSQAENGEKNRRVSDEVIKGLSGEGMFGLFLPENKDRDEVSLRSFLEVVSTLSEGDGSSGWLAAVCNSCAWMANLFPKRAREELFGSGHTPIVSGVVAPTAKTRRVDGGYVVTGRWNYNSGSWHAEWAVLGAPLSDADGEAAEQGLLLIPASEYTVEETWFTAGLRATGSNTLVAEEVFVPEHRARPAQPLFDGAHCADQREAAVYRSAFAPFVSTIIVGPLLGLGRAVLKEVTRRAPDKGVAFTFFERQSDSVAYQVAVAEAALRIDTAHLHAYRAADTIDRSASRSEHPDDFMRARIRADLGHVVENMTAAIDGLMYVHGSGGFAEADPLQRLWRDAHMAARHAVVQPSIGKEIYGKALLGVDEKISPMS